MFSFFLNFEISLFSLFLFINLLKNLIINKYFRNIINYKIYF